MNDIQADTELIRSGGMSGPADIAYYVALIRGALEDKGRLDPTESEAVVTSEALAALDAVVEAHEWLGELNKALNEQYALAVGGSTRNSRNKTKCT